jgi:UDP-N-acetyl-D-mannosaminuronate dehydrogenase
VSANEISTILSKENGILMEATIFPFNTVRRLVANDESNLSVESDFVVTPILAA